MVAKPLTTEFVALTEKKMDMSLDDIIKMSKNTNSWKPKRVPNKSQKFPNTVAQDKSLKMRRHMESRSSIRQGFIAKRSNFQGDQFPLANERAQKAVAAPLHFRVSNQNKMASWNKLQRFRIPVSQRRAASGGFTAKPAPSPPQQQQQQQSDANMMPKQRPQTLDSLFANMKEERMKVLSSQDNAVLHNGAWSRRPQWGRGRFGN